MRRPHQGFLLGRRGRHHRRRRSQVSKLLGAIAVASVSASTMAVAVGYLVWEPAMVYATTLSAPTAAPETVLYGSTPAGIADLTVSVAICQGGAPRRGPWPRGCTPVASVQAVNGTWRIVLTSCVGSNGPTGCPLLVQLRSNSPAITGTRLLDMMPGTARRLDARVAGRRRPFLAIFLGASY